MSPWAIWFLTEGIKLLVGRLNDTGKYNTMTEEEAQAEFNTLVASLPAKVKSPEELESEGGPT
jgi:hypothetical protein